MKEETALFFIENYPVASLVSLALSFVNLTKPEETVLELCCKNQSSQELAAEVLGVSRNTVNKLYRSAVRKVCYAWNGSDWIEILVAELQKKPKT